MTNADATIEHARLLRRHKTNPGRPWPGRDPARLKAYRENLWKLGIDNSLKFL